MELSEKSYAKAICHDCHKHADSEDVMLFPELGFSDITFDDPDTCPRCICPDIPIDVVMLFCPLYRCECGNIIIQYTTKIFACSECRLLYSDMILKLVEVMQRNGMSHNHTVTFDGLLDEPIIGCDGINHINVIEIDQLANYISYFTDCELAPNSKYSIRNN